MLVYLSKKTSALIAQYTVYDMVSHKKNAITWFEILKNKYTPSLLMNNPETEYVNILHFKS